MSNSTPEERAASRAEARRRARLVARGQATPSEEGVIDERPLTPERGGFLQRLFPPAPPLPNRPDPLASFDRRAPLRPVRERLYLLRKNPLAWMLPSLLCFVGYFASLEGAGGLLGLIGTFFTFGSLIAAGWFGWQRPPLFGVVSALIAYALVWGVVYATFAQQGVGAATFGSPIQVAGTFALRGAIQGVLGFVGGWYGGYLRRRQAQVSAASRSADSAQRRR